MKDKNLFCFRITVIYVMFRDYKKYGFILPDLNMRGLAQLQEEFLNLLRKKTKLLIKQVNLSASNSCTHCVNGKRQLIVTNA
jgi:hypothetical protein